MVSNTTRIFIKSHKNVKQMKVKIVKCSGPGWWYSDRIGDVFKVKQAKIEWGDAPDDWEVSDKESYNYGDFILKTDCEIIEQ